MGRFIFAFTVVCVVSASMGLIAKAHSADLQVETIQSQIISQPPCSERDDVLELLARKYKEVPFAAGMTSTGGLLEVLTDYKSGTWTIIVTMPQGMSCLVAAGEGWRAIEKISLDPEA